MDLPYLAIYFFGNFCSQERRVNKYCKLKKKNYLVPRKSEWSDQEWNLIPPAPPPLLIENPSDYTSLQTPIRIPGFNPTNLEVLGKDRDDNGVIIPVQDRFIGIANSNITSACKH